MNYQIIPNLAYLGKQVYTKDNDDELLSVSLPVAIPLLQAKLHRSSSSSEPKIEYISLQDGAGFRHVYIGYLYPVNGVKQLLQEQWEQDGFGWNRDPRHLIIPTKFVIYEKQHYLQRYKKLGYFIKIFKDPTGPLYYYFSENPSQGYNKLEDLYYDPQPASKKAGKKTRKNKK